MQATYFILWSQYSLDGKNRQWSFLIGHYRFLIYLWTWILLFFIIFFIFYFFCLFAISWATPVAHGGSQARGQIVTIATATWDLSRVCGVHHSSQQHRILTHWARPGIEPETSWFLVGFVNHCSTTGTLEKDFKKMFQLCFIGNKCTLKLQHLV